MYVRALAPVDGWTAKTALSSTTSSTPTTTPPTTHIHSPTPTHNREGFLGAAGLTIAAAPGLVRLLRALLGSIPEDDIGALGGLLPLSDWQALWLAFFASFGAPLGGILASAAKRAVEMKDFGQRCVLAQRAHRGVGWLVGCFAEWLLA